MTNTNLYEFLGVPRDASAEQINKVFREKALVLHPDKNRDDPDAAKKFKILMQAYQILTDPMRRDKYDATLPTFFPEASGESNLQSLWQSTAQRFFDQSDRYSPAIDALRISRPLLLDGEDMLVVGIEHEQANLIGYLTVSITHNQIRRILTELFGKPLDFRLISGLELEDWHEVKATEERAKQRRALAEKAANAAPPVERNIAPPPYEPRHRPVEKAAPPPVAARAEEHAVTAIAEPVATMTEGRAAATPSDVVWDEIMEEMTRTWNESTARTQALTRARYILEMMPLIARGEDMTRGSGMEEDMLHQHLSRAIDRAANLANIASGVVALEYLRHRTRLIRGTR